MNAIAAVHAPSDDAIRLVAELQAIGVTLALRPDGSVSFRAPAPIADSTLADARRLRSDIATVLRAQLQQLPDSHVGRSINPPRPIDTVRCSPSWDDMTNEPQAGDRCRCCGFSAWWTETENPRGWRCATCHPPPLGLATCRVAP